MRLPIFASFIVFIVVLTYELSKRKNTESRIWKDYWTKEQAANSTRRKPLDTLDYVMIPFHELPTQVMAEETVIKDCLSQLLELSSEKIVNLTGISNTDLKLQYGAPNLNMLVQYDLNYTTLVRLLQTWAEELYHHSYTAEAKRILEFAVSTRTDVRATYVLLAKIYEKYNEAERISELLQTAETLNSAMKPSIVRALQEFCPHNG